MTDYDSNKINIQNPLSSQDNDVEMAPHEQIIDVVASFDLRDDLGVNVGDMYKMRVRNYDKDL